MTDKTTPATDLTSTDTPATATPADGTPAVAQPVAQDLPPAARRALAEAEARRQQAAAVELPKELGGRNGLDPVRYGDWEKKGIAIDF